jgi:hypothetical protein
MILYSRQKVVCRFGYAQQYPMVTKRNPTSVGHHFPLKLLGLFELPQVPTTCINDNPQLPEMT